MENIFKDAYFGKLYKTRDGRKAIYTIMSCDSHWLAIQDTSFTWEYSDNGELVTRIDNAMDIVAVWQEKIDEEELDKLAEESNPNNPHGDTYEAGQYFGFDDGFKAGYLKRMEV